MPAGLFGEVSKPWWAPNLAGRLAKPLLLSPLEDAPLSAAAGADGASSDGDGLFVAVSPSGWNHVCLPPCYLLPDCHL